MEHQTLKRLPPYNGSAKRLYDKFSPEPFTDIPANYFAIPEIQDYAQIKPSLTRPEIGDI
jgi:hypothetical protein